MGSEHQMGGVDGWGRQHSFPSFKDPLFYILEEKQIVQKKSLQNSYFQLKTVSQKLERINTSLIPVALN